jgi:fumarylacetoacetase
MIGETHDRARRSWVDSANNHPEFPLQNLPFGIFSPRGGSDESPRGGIAIGDSILDLRAALGAGMFSGEAERAAEAASGAALNPLMALGPEYRRALRRQVFALLDADGPGRDKAEKLADRLLHRAAECWLHLPAAIGNFTDFFAGIHHAANGGRRRDPNNPLSPNYKYVPVAYHSRASSVRESDIPVRRPNGQRKLPTEDAPSYGPSRNLDYELELAVWIGPGNAQGEPIPIGQADQHIFGLGLINDWSARDIQYWEMPPLGPFLGKNFGSTESPRIVTADALEPFRVAQPPRPSGDPRPLP